MTPTAATAASEILAIMLRHLGYHCQLDISPDENSPLISITADETAAPALIGKAGAHLEDLQHLVNKLLRQKMPQAVRVRLDVNGFRTSKDDSFLDSVRQIAAEVRSTKRPAKLEPMNSYQRRLVHSLFKDDPDIKSWSPEDTSRMKRITLLPR